MRAEKSAAREVSDAEHGHDGRSEEKKIADEAVDGTKIKVHG